MTVSDNPRQLARLGLRLNPVSSAWVICHRCADIVYAEAIRLAQEVIRRPVLWIGQTWLRMFNQSVSSGTNTFVWWETHGIKYFREYNPLFESELKSRLTGSDWTVLVACHMGIAGYRALCDSRIMHAELKEWAIKPLLRNEPFPSVRAASRVNMGVSARDTTVKVHAIHRERFRFSSHLELLFASDQIIRAKAENMRDTEISVIKEIESLYSNAVSVIREGEEAHSLRRTEKSAHKIRRTRVNAACLIASDFANVFIKRNDWWILWTSWNPGAAIVWIFFARARAIFGPPKGLMILMSSLSSLERGSASVLTDIGSPPANEAVAVARHAESNIAPSIQARSSPLESRPEANQRRAILKHQTLTTVKMQTGTNPTSKLPTDRQDQADKPASSTVASNTDGEVDGLSWRSTHEIEDADEQQGLIRLRDIAVKMNKPLRMAARTAAGDELWSNLVFLNIRKTKARILHGCKIANRTKISDWDLIPTKGERVCDRCTNLYPCEYTTIGDTVKCRECRINGKGCSWAGHADLVIDNDTVIESNVKTARLSPEAESETQSNTFQRIAAQFVGRYTRTNAVLPNEEVLNTEIDEAQTADAKAGPRLVGEIATQSGRDKKFGATTKTKKRTNIETVPSPGLMTRSKSTKEQSLQVNQKGTSDGSAFANGRKRARKDSLTTRNGEPSSQGRGEKNKESMSFTPPHKRPRNWGPNFLTGITLRPEQLHGPADGTKSNPLKKSEVTIRPDQSHGPDEGATLKPWERPLLTQTSSKASDARVPRGLKPDTPTVSLWIQTYTWFDR
ncbi:hypothetical protein ARMGADRAFT_1034697 [Armillaria gallica]|uniref:Uncharacterized protein n=1 Tax=Armillaria gallica TaxID=47427 RepID=A0A2H3D9F0_ARMGA|nr:hypothetical protein ARMGADRAFT_1034697 [Armillaria gallica]